MEPIELPDGLEVPILEGTRFSVDRCVYCGAEQGLSDEHIVPYALGGTAVLARASCEPCRVITGELERRVLRGSMWKLRVSRGLPSRRRHRDAPEVHPITLVEGQQDRIVEVPLDQHPIFVGFPIFEVPGVLNPSYTGGLLARGIAGFRFGEDPKALAAELGGDDIRVEETVSGSDFARMLAKIAWCFAYALGETEGLERHPPILDAILDKGEPIGRWVGTHRGRVRQPYSGHALGIRRDDASGWASVSVQLFAGEGTPSYHVVLGRIAG